MNKIIKSITSEFSTKTIVLIPICAGINLIGGSIAGALKLPVFLDLIGTIIAAALGGPWVSAVVGLFTNLFLALMSNPTYFPYVLVSIAVGLQTGYMIKAGCFRNIVGVVSTCFVATILSTFVTSAVTLIFFGGVTGATGASVITAGFIASLGNIWLGVLTSAFFSNLVDRAIAFAVAYIILKTIPKRFISQYQKNALSKKKHKA
ncbi:MAG: ECF transporter S component [Acetivibrio sp.]